MGDRWKSKLIQANPTKSGLFVMHFFSRSQSRACGMGPHFRAKLHFARMGVSTGLPSCGHTLHAKCN